jgi:hypothetical protein
VFWLVLIIVLLIGILIGLVLARLRQPPPPPPPRTPGPQSAIPDNFDPALLSSTISVRLAGTPADGSLLTTSIGNQVIWVDSGDEVLVHLDSIQTRILDRVVLISIDLESDQSGRTPLIVSFAIGNAIDPAGLIAVTDEYPRGDGSLAARWGEAVQAALWSTLLGLAQDHATERGKAPAGISAAPGVLTLHAGNPIGAQA